MFKAVAYEFISSNQQQDLPQTIPHHSLATALSGALHVEPPGYLDCVRSGQIQIFEASVECLEGRGVRLMKKSGQTTTIKADNVILGTGYNLVSRTKQHVKQ